MSDKNKNSSNKNSSNRHRSSSEESIHKSGCLPTSFAELFLLHQPPVPRLTINIEKDKSSPQIKKDPKEQKKKPPNDISPADALYLARVPFRKDTANTSINQTDEKIEETSIPITESKSNKTRTLKDPVSATMYSFNFSSKENTDLKPKTASSVNNPGVFERYCLSCLPATRRSQGSQENNIEQSKSRKPGSKISLQEEPYEKTFWKFSKRQ